MPATIARPRTADFILAPLRRTLAYAEALVKDIPAEKFAHMPHPTMNHPAFIIGHLSIYPSRLFMLIDRPELEVDRPTYQEVFKAGVQCVPNDGRYPAKDEIVSHYLAGYTGVANALTTVPDEVFERENPMEGRMRELFPSVGSAVNFLANNHQMMHLGQVSAWRRAIGLGSAM